MKNNDDGTAGRPYGHAIVAGLAKEPRKVTNQPECQAVICKGCGCSADQPLQNTTVQQTTCLGRFASAKAAQDIFLTFLGPSYEVLDMELSSML